MPPPAWQRYRTGTATLLHDNGPIVTHAGAGAGGAPVGEQVTLQTSDGRRVTWCYVTDPEGNIIELQTWSGPEA